MNRASFHMMPTGLRSCGKIRVGLGILLVKIELPLNLIGSLTDGFDLIAGFFSICIT